MVVRWRQNGRPISCIRRVSFSIPVGGDGIPVPGVFTSRSEASFALIMVFYQKPFSIYDWLKRSYFYLESPTKAVTMATRSEREKAQKLNEQHQAILSKMLREEDNKYCADCEAKGTVSTLAT